MVGTSGTAFSVGQRWPHQQEKLCGYVCIAVTSPSADTIYQGGSGSLEWEEQGEEGEESPCSPASCSDTSAAASFSWSLRGAAAAR